MPCWGELKTTVKKERGKKKNVNSNRKESDNVLICEMKEMKRKTIVDETGLTVLYIYICCFNSPITLLLLLL